MKAGVALGLSFSQNRRTQETRQWMAVSTVKPGNTTPRCRIMGDRGTPAVPLRGTKNIRPEGAETSQPRATPWDTGRRNGSEALKGRNNRLDPRHTVRGLRSPAGLQNPGLLRLRVAAHIGPKTGYVRLRAADQVNHTLRKGVRHGWLASYFALSGLMAFGWCLCTQGVALG